MSTAGRRPTGPCARWDREAPVRFKGFRAEHLKMIDWHPYHGGGVRELVRAGTYRGGGGGVGAAPGIQIHWYG